MNPERWLGVVLAGGRSTRFGGEKAVALLRDRPLMTWCADALNSACAVVAINARRGDGAEALAQSLGLDVIYDDATHPAGPLAGVAASLIWARAYGFNGLVTLPCDTPLVGADELRRLVGALEGGRPVRPASTAKNSRGGRHVHPPAAYALAAGGAQVLCAAWRVSLAEPLNARLATGDHPAVHQWLDEIGAAAVAFADAAPFQNINTRGDLAAIEADA